MIKAAVLGSPISHSLSPLLHQAAYSFLGVDASYEAIEVRSGGLSDFIDLECFLVNDATQRGASETRFKN